MTSVQSLSLTTIRISKMKTVKKKVAKIAPKDRLVIVYLRNVSAETKRKFNAKAKSLGYLPRELFELMVGKL
jgi:hypothetical protein